MKCFIKRHGIKRSNLPLDATRVFTFLLNLDIDYKSIILSLSTFTLLLFFLASSDLLGVLTFSSLRLDWDQSGLQSLFIGFYKTTLIWTMRWSWTLDAWRILINPIRSWFSWSIRILDPLIFKSKHFFNRICILFELHQKKKLAGPWKGNCACRTALISRLILWPSRLIKLISRLLYFVSFLYMSLYLS